jgi:hypothetical protein
MSISDFSVNIIFLFEVLGTFEGVAQKGEDHDAEEIHCEAAGHGCPAEEEEALLL